jgi:hypothetical protein
LPDLFRESMRTEHTNGTPLSRTGMTDAALACTELMH